MQTTAIPKQRLASHAKGAVLLSVYSHPKTSGVTCFIFLLYNNRYRGATTRPQDGSTFLPDSLYTKESAETYSEENEMLRCPNIPGGCSGQPIYMLVQDCLQAGEDVGVPPCIL